MKLLVIVDYQNDFVDGALGFQDANAIEEYLLQSIDAFEKEGNEIVYTLDTHDEDYLLTEEGKNLPVKHCIKGSKGYELVNTLKEKLDKKKCFEKKTFGSLELANYIATKKYEEIVLMGLVSNMCVLANAILCKSANPNAHIVLDARGSRSFDKNLEEKAYEVCEAIHIEIRR